MLMSAHDCSLVALRRSHDLGAVKKKVCTVELAKSAELEFSLFNDVKVEVSVVIE